MRYAVITSLLLLGGLAGVYTTKFQTDVTAQARSRTIRVLSTRKLSKKTVHITKGNMYSSPKLKTITHVFNSYKYITFYRVKQAKIVKRNGEKSTYQYVRSTDGKFKGWVSATNVKAGKAPVRGAENFHEEKATRELLAIVNKARTQRKISPLSLDTKLSKLARLEAFDTYNEKKESDHMDLNEKKVGINFSGNLVEGEIIDGFGLDNRSGKLCGDEYVHPSWSDNGMRPYILDASYTRIGIGWYNKDRGFSNIILSDGRN